MMTDPTTAPLTIDTDPDKPRHLVGIRKPPRYAGDTAAGEAASGFGEPTRVLHYWQPSKTLRKLGWLQRRLADDYPTARGQAIAINAALDVERAAATAGEIPAGTPSQRKGTVAWLIAEFENDRRYLEKKAKTRSGYDQLLGVIGKKFGDAPIRALTRKVLERWYNKLRRRTPWQANALMRMTHRLLHVAWTYDEIEVNPAAKMELAGCDPRHQLWEPAPTALLVDVAIACQRRSIALASMMSRELGQRETDIVGAMTWRKYVDGRFRLRQSKGGKWVEVIATAELRAMLDATPRTSTHIIVSETTGRPYGIDNFMHVFARIRDFAAIADPELAELQYRDFRRTCVVELARAGATPAEIAAITGHEIDRVVKILETYLPRDSIMAAHGVEKLEAWRRRQAKGDA